MPNGGTPIHMILKPENSDLVIHCLTSEVRISERDEWESNVKTLFPTEEEKKDNGTPIATLSEDEASALVGFLKHWLHEASEPWHMREHIDVDFA